MTSTLDSLYFRDRFSTAAMRAIFSDDARIRSWVAVEVTLARVQAELGVIPQNAADTIARAADPAALDIAAMAGDYARTGVAIVPLVRHLGQQCGPDAARWLHWGATTQDILDTGTALQIRAALGLVADDLDAVARACAGLAARHRDTVMAGRSFQQQAVPVTFGLKAAGWLDEILRHRTRLEEMRPRLLVGQYGGAVGTLAPLGADGPAVRAGLMRALGLHEPAITWHAARDRWAELMAWLAMLTGTLARIATEVAALMRTELAEVAEPAAGASSTMPQKRNPVASPQIIAIATRMRALVAPQLDAMVQEHERGTAAMPVEWLGVPEAFLLTSGALAHARPMLEGLSVDAARMRANLDLGGGFVMAEAVMMGLAPKIGRAAAHELVTQVVQRALAGGQTLRAALLAEPEVTAHLDAPALDRLLEPSGYTGSAGAMIDAVLAAARAQGLAD
jgi:3-carboxy-cis,cis-muconate cycloisomerase